MKQIPECFQTTPGTIKLWFRLRRKRSCGQKLAGNAITMRIFRIRKITRKMDNCMERK